MNLFTKIFNIGNVLPSKQVRQGLLLQFPKARSVEWTDHRDYWEAIFYDKKVEKIARIDNRGKLIEYRVNLTGDAIPDTISKSLNNNHEIMNCIAIYTSGSIQYELIVRDNDLTRSLIILDQAGQIINEEKL